MVFTSICILGRLPAIGRAELESLYGAEHVQALGDRAVGMDVPLEQVVFARLGGSVRLARPVAELPTTQWPDIHRYLLKLLPQELDSLPAEGKVKLGISAIGLTVNRQALLRAGLELKKVCKKAGRSARVVPSEEAELSSAQVLHNQLTGEMGIELLCIRNGNTTLVAKTVAVQDITAYARRDQGRPKRDARVGMLPPKLAQTIVNLATGPLAPSIDVTVLDPFCGTGVVLQEALLMGYSAYGTDLEPRMIDYTRQNLKWLTSVTTGGGSPGGTPDARSVSEDDGGISGLTGPPPVTEVGDATEHVWQAFSVVASETYLGRPLGTWPTNETLREIMDACNLILKKTLKNLANQIPAGTRLCLAVPAWRGPGNSLHHLPLLDHLSGLGYNRLRFEHAAQGELVYYRPEQIVARELLVITRN